MSDFNYGALVDFQGETYSVVKDEGDSVLAKRAGAHEPITLPKDQVRPILQEGRAPYDLNKKLNG